ncbi:stage III sporulation protein AD [Desulfotomaculum copahuensis]|uniref:Stage III sporulation protein AD n=1 Tax=Desulfotomaculum copahuensis TaxID=1838280 RepID=A0A1B7LIY5_9FIRM|nr:stage III sporulation protein AD [Desulfotomaculum copahuensis]OAT86539.1 stage III sporulation protein AD [Desulfotomaculum copahuensis]
MEIMQLVGLGLVAAVLAVTIRHNKPELAMLLSVATGIMIFLAVLGKIGAVIDVLKELSERASLNMVYLGTLLKIVGIAYIADFGAQICRDAGEGAIGAKIEFAAKILVLVLAVPIVAAVLQSLLKLVP